MKENDKTEEWYAELRRVAERKVRVAQGDVVDMTSLVHELEVRQVELELQNEELRHARNETEAALARYADLFEFAPVAYFTLDERGLILQANLTASVYLDLPRSQINGQPFENFLIPDSRVRLNPLLDHVFRTGQREVF